MKRYRAALIGCGGMSKSHLPALHEVAEIDVVAACDIDEGRLHAVGDAFNVENRYTDYHAMFAAEKLDIVAIATQGPQHCAATVAAAEHGVHVLCEKPMALDLAEADQMVEACDKAGVKLAINHQATVRPSLKRMRSMIENGDIGEIILVRGNNKSGRKAGNELMGDGHPRLRPHAVYRRRAAVVLRAPHLERRVCHHRSHHGFSGNESQRPRLRLGAR